MRYAPDEQHDAAMHILFSMDAALSSVPWNIFSWRTFWLLDWGE
jgi:hypothetical protein